MSGPTIETSVILWADRYTPVKAVAEQARVLTASGVVDGMHFADQLVNFIPSQLWTTEHTPMAAVLPDPDSHPDAFVMSAYAAAAAPDLQVTISTDSVRHFPTEFVQTMMTLANVTEGKVTFHVGAGENKQCQPYGHRRAQGISRMEDLLKMFHAYWQADGPISFEGRRTTLDHAYIGGARPYRPAIWALGGGPKLIDYATSYCDGLTAAVPAVWSTPEQCAEQISMLRGTVESKGRDPDAFRFGTYVPMLIHEDPNVLDAALDNPLVKFMTAVFGRVEPTNWTKVGLTPPVPKDWNYSSHLLPYNTEDAFIDEVLANTTREHVRQAWLIGTPEEAAEQFRPYVDAGLSWALPMDYLPMIADPSDAAQALPRTLAFCKALKAA